MDHQNEKTKAVGHTMPHGGGITRQEPQYHQAEYSGDSPQASDPSRSDVLAHFGRQYASLGRAERNDARELLDKIEHAEAAVAGIGWAVKQMRDGNRVSRQGWNGKDMWLALQSPDPFSKMTRPFVYIKAADGNYMPWLCSQADLLASDWFVVLL